jgi:selenocysteine-specific elongation factor
LVVTGSVFSGSVATGDELLISPQNISVRVRGIHAQNKATNQGHAGDRCAINITGTNLDRDQIHRGNWLLSAGAHAPVERIDARISVLPSETRPLKHWTPLHIHSAANHITGRVAVLEKRQIAPGENGLVQLVLDEPIGICHGDRLIIRDQSASRTIGGGQVVDPFSPRRGRAKQERINQLLVNESQSPEQSLAELLKLYPTGLNLTNFAVSRNLTRIEQQALYGKLVARQIQLDSEGRSYLCGFNEDLWQSHKAHITDALRSWHQDHTEQLGPGEKQLLACVRPKPWPEVFALAISEMIKSRQIMKSGSYLHIPGHSASLTSAEMKVWQVLEPLLKADGLKPPVLHELSKQSRLPVKQLDQFLKRATQLGLVVRVVKNRFFLQNTVNKLRQLAVELDSRKGEDLFTASEYRDVTGIGRNLAIEVLEYFDGIGFTQRQGDKRKVLENYPRT